MTVKSAVSKFLSLDHEAWFHRIALAPIFLIIGLVLAVYAGIIPPYEYFDTDSFGTITMVFLAALLACSPLYLLFKWRAPLRWRKPLGLYAFGYGLLHYLTYSGEFSYNNVRTLEDSLTDPLILFGLIGFAIMIPLAITSNKRSMKILGKGWKKLHRLTYVAAIFAIAHVILFGEAGLEVWLSVLFLGMRLPRARQWILDNRDRWLKSGLYQQGLSLKNDIVKAYN